jgi:hypothetical protein
MGGPVMDLSVLIPARNEQFLRPTVENVLANIRGNTEIIVVLDGAWAAPPLEQHPRVHVLYHPQAVGQRAATNHAARVSDAEFICKLDAHCTVAEGFDVALIEAARELGPDVTQIPAQRNLHVYDQVCDACAFRADQAPSLPACPQCQGPLRKDVVFEPRRSPTTTAWRFDSDLHFNYWREAERRQDGDICDVMSCLGACWFMSRERYWRSTGSTRTTDRGGRWAPRSPVNRGCPAAGWWSTSARGLVTFSASAASGFPIRFTAASRTTRGGIRRISGAGTTGRSRSGRCRGWWRSSRRCRGGLRNN